MPGTQGEPGEVKGPESSYLKGVGSVASSPSLAGLDEGSILEFFELISVWAETAHFQLPTRRAQKQEAINEEGKKTMEDSPSYSPLEEKEVTPAPEDEAEKDSDNGVPVPTPPVIPEPKDTEKHIPVPSPPEVPEPKESEEQVVKEEKVESAGPGVQEHQDSGEDSPAAPVGQEEIEEVGGAPKDEEMPACKQEDNEEAAPEAGAPVPHVKEEPLPND